MQEWTKGQMLNDFDVLGFAMGQCVVRRKSDGVDGLLSFESRTPASGILPSGAIFRVYFDFQPVEGASDPV